MKCFRRNKDQKASPVEEQSPSFHRDQGRESSEDDDPAIRELKNKLAEQKYHIQPENTWWQDWIQYMCNNHPILSLFLHHRHHPVSQGMRWIGLIGSIVIGLAITNVVWLLFIYDDRHADAVVITFSAGGLNVNNETKLAILEENNRARQATQVQVNTGMLVLWTLGAMIHSAFDGFIWQVAAGLCCVKRAADSQANNEENSGDAQNQKGKFSKCFNGDYQRYGTHLTILMVALLTALSTLIVVVRVTLDQEDGSIQDITKAQASLHGDDGESYYDIKQVKDASNYEFLLSYAVELGVAWLVYFPLMTTISMSGVLACFRPIWCLGGRVYEIAQEARGSDEEAPQELDK